MCAVTVFTAMTGRTASPPNCAAERKRRHAIQFPKLRHFTAHQSARPFQHRQCVSSLIDASSFVYVEFFCFCLLVFCKLPLSLSLLCVGGHDSPLNFCKLFSFLFFKAVKSFTSANESWGRKFLILMSPVPLILLFPPRESATAEKATQRSCITTHNHQ